MRLNLNNEQLRRLVEREENFEVSAGEVMPEELLQTVIDEPEITLNWELFPIKEMMKRGWIKRTTRDIHKQASSIMQEFISALPADQPMRAFCRRTFKQRTESSMDYYALLAWTSRILIRARTDSSPAKYKAGTVNGDFMREVAHLSVSDEGPLLAKSFLEEHGIVLVVEEHLPRTKLDGAAILSSDGNPVVGLTLRYDRLDNFWFTLMHELAHVALHLHDSEEAFIDDMTVGSHDDILEKEADRLAAETFIPKGVWRPSRARRQKTVKSVVDLANKLNIHPSIIAGRIRYETGDYQLLNDLVGHGQVRKFFN